MKLVLAALRNPHAVIVFMLFLVVIGVTALLRIPADLLPIFKTPAIQVVTLYPGMPPVVVEKDISSRMQRWTGQSVGIDHQEARSMLGVSIVRDFFREEVSAESAMSQVTSLAVSDMFYLPPGTLPPMVMPFDPTASVPICLVSVSSPTMTEKELYDVAYYDMRNKLQAIQGVIAPAVYGGVLRRILTYVDPDKLQAVNMSPLDVAKSLRDSNPFVPVGSATLDGSEYFIRSNAMVEHVEDLNEFPLRVDNGVPIRIGDIGHARDSNQIQSNIVRINGRRQAYIPIYRQPGSNTLEIVKRVRERSQFILDQIRGERGDKVADLSLDVVLDQSVTVRGSIDNLTTSGIIGAILVAFVVFLFLRSIISTSMVLLCVPLAILGSLAGLYFTGDTINAMTLGGLSLAIGILVDQSIVVMENITRHLKSGKTPMAAARDGAGEVAMPVLVSTLTFMVVFFPVVYLTGLARFLFSPLALAVIFATITSYLLAMTLIPAAASRLMRTVPDTGQSSAGPLDKLSASYRSLAAVTIRMRWAVLGLAVVLFGFAGLGLNNLGSELFPQVDGGQFMVLVRAQPGTSLKGSEVLVQKVEAEIRSEIGMWDTADESDPNSDLKLLISNIGVLYDWPAAYTPNTGPMDSFVLVQLKDSRKKTAQQHAAALRARLPANEEFAGVEFSFDTGGMMTAALNMGLPAPINIQVRGGNLDVLQEIGQAIAREARQVEGAVDVRVDEPPDHPSIEIEVDRMDAAMLGLSQSDVIKNVATAVNSSCNFLASYWISPQNGNHYLMGAQYEESDINSLASLENIPITGPKSKTPTLLKNIATIRRGKTPVVVTHKNITRTVNVFANVVGRDVGSVAEDIYARLDQGPVKKLMDEYGKLGYRLHKLGEVKSMSDSFSDFSQGLIIAAILVYLVMVAQFRSFLLPLTILLSVPLGLIGVVPVLWASGTYLSVPAFMGLILMIGIVVQYSILVVEFAVRRQREGVALNDAILDAARDRLRPVLMTSLTTILALLPMAIGFGRGGEANIPLARAIIGAVLGGAFLSLLVVPALYSVLGRWVRPDTLEAETV
ncbi:MAG: efflux RND transporter permease subunit [Planctomycetota bacterium]|nr:efflux RND transporter permease subunit [Planctomycetota bacterium]